MKSDKICFHHPAKGSKEKKYLSAALAGENLSAEGPFSQKCEQWLQEKTGCLRAFLTPSASSALEVAAILAGIKAGDEVIIPSFTFPSTANSFALRGAVPVFIDVREDTLCMDEGLLRGTITEKTRAIVPVHYGGLAADMEKICAIAGEYGLIVIEDAAQSLLAYQRGKHLGAFGSLSCISFHDTKNVGCGEGGALLINDPALIEKAEMARNFGTNRSAFLRGETDHYHWVSAGSSSMMGELAAACLLARLEEAEAITSTLIDDWNYYDNKLSPLAEEGIFRLLRVPSGCNHNGHIFALILKKSSDRDRLIDFMKDRGIEAKSHYVPLHETPYGREVSRMGSPLDKTSHAAAGLVRLPLWNGISRTHQERVIRTVKAFFDHA